MKRLAALIFVPFLLSACGADNRNDTTVDLTMSDIQNGVAALTVTITDENGAPVTAGEVRITPIMNMDSGMVHSTPIANQFGQLNQAGQFTTTAYFLMSSMGGDWNVEVEYNSKVYSFDIQVDMLMSDRKVLKGNSSDVVDHMGDDVARSYYLFNLGRDVTTTQNQFTIYVTARETLMDYQAITDGAVLNAETNYELIVGTVVVEMCSSDCDTEANWKTAIENLEAPGEYTATALNLAGDDSDSIEVRLTIGGERKTSDGTESGSNATFTFASTESTMGMMSLTGL